jgi:hypothetical protein
MSRRKKPKEKQQKKPPKTDKKTSLRTKNIREMVFDNQKAAWGFCSGFFKAI